MLDKLHIKNTFITIQFEIISINVNLIWQQTGYKKRSGITRNTLDEKPHIQIITFIEVSNLGNFQMTQDERTKQQLFLDTSPRCWPSRINDDDAYAQKGHQDPKGTLCCERADMGMEEARRNGDGPWKGHRLPKQCM